MTVDQVRPLPASLEPWASCPVCAGALAVTVGEPGAQPHLECAGTCGRAWYANPKPTANVLAERPSRSSRRRGWSPA